MPKTMNSIVSSSYSHKIVVVLVKLNLPSNSCRFLGSCVSPSHEAEGLDTLHRMRDGVGDSHTSLRPSQSKLLTLCVTTHSRF